MRYVGGLTGSSRSTSQGPRCSRTGWRAVVDRVLSVMIVLPLQVLVRLALCGAWDKSEPVRSWECRSWTQDKSTLLHNWCRGTFTPQRWRATGADQKAGSRWRLASDVLWMVCSSGALLWLVC